MENLDRESKYFKAKERVQEIKKFYGNLTSYAIVISGLAILNYYLDGWNHPWFLWPALGWGIGLAFHAASAFNWNPFFGKDWEERKINQLMQEDNKTTIKRWK